MKFLSQLFGAQGTDWTYKAFKQARLKLVLIYLTIIAVVIVMFSYLVILQVTKKEWSRSLPENSDILLNAEEARLLAEQKNPDATVIDTQYQLAERTILYEFDFDNGDEIYVDILTGSVVQEGRNYEKTILQLLSDETGEIIWWYALIVFLLASLGSALVANVTLNPIALSIRKQKRFVSDAAHEIRNPLAALQTSLESYKRSTEPSKKLSQTVVDDMLHEVRRLIDTTESLLSFERHEKNKNISDCSVYTTLQTITERLNQLLEEKSITVHQNINDYPIRIDPLDLYMILYNLIHNAVKFSGVNSDITIVWDGKELLVSDTGAGIAHKDAPHIFDRFYKADESRSFEVSSNGLGLALVAEVVHWYGGNISFESKVGRGTTFKVTFPN